MQCFALTHDLPNITTKQPQQKEKLKLRTKFLGLPYHQHPKNETKYTEDRQNACSSIDFDH